MIGPAFADPGTALDGMLDAATSALLQVYPEPKFARAATCWQRTRQFTAGWHAALWQAEGVGERLVSRRKADAILRGRSFRLPASNASEVADALIAHMAAALCRAMIATRELYLAGGAAEGSLPPPQIGNIVGVLDRTVGLKHRETARRPRIATRPDRPKRERKVGFAKVARIEKRRREG